MLSRNPHYMCILVVTRHAKKNSLNSKYNEPSVVIQSWDNFCCWEDFFGTQPRMSMLRMSQGNFDSGHFSTSGRFCYRTTFAPETFHFDGEVAQKKQCVVRIGETHPVMKNSGAYHYRPAALSVGGGISTSNLTSRQNARF